MKKVILVVFPLSLLLGCASHRYPARYTYSVPPSTTTVSSPTYTYSTTIPSTTVSPTVVTVSPTSDQPVTRVYPPKTATFETPAAVVTTAPIVVTEAPAGVTVQPSGADMGLADDVRRALTTDPTLNSAGRNVRISIYNGQVTMTGTTATPTERDRLHEAIVGTPGVNQVIDRTQVSQPVRVVTPSSVVVAEAPVGVTTSPSSNDFALADAIKNLLATDGGLNSAARNVRISVYDGLVSMTGTTVTQSDRERIHSAVATLPGVYRVNDKVAVDLNH